MIAAGVAYWVVRRRRPGDVARPWLLRALLAASPLGFLALEAGWFVTEVGRQPWVIYNVMPTADAVTPVSGVPVTFFGFSVVYLALGTALVLLLRRLATGAPAGGGSEEVGHVA